MEESEDDEDLSDDDESEDDPAEKFRLSSKLNDGLSKRLVQCIEECIWCPVCRTEAPHGSPIYQCPNGHVLCSSCRNRLLSCPVCREVLTLPPIRNRALEKLSSLLQ